MVADGWHKTSENKLSLASAWHIYTADGPWSAGPAETIQKGCL